MLRELKEKHVTVYGAGREDDPRGQPSAAPAAGTRIDGVLNGKAVSLPRPAYPPIARAAYVSGVVGVQVIVDLEGKVIAAQAVSGHPFLRPAAVKAAREARFSPPLLNGKPVYIVGVISYNFAP